MSNVGPESPERAGALIWAWWWALTIGGPLVPFLSLGIPGMGPKIESSFFTLLILIPVIHFVVTLMLAVHIHRQKGDRGVVESIFVFMGLLVGGWVIMGTCAFVGCLAVVQILH